MRSTVRLVVPSIAHCTRSETGATGLDYRNFSTKQQAMEHLERMTYS